MNAVANWISEGKYRHWYVFGAGIAALIAMSGIRIHDLILDLETVEDFFEGLKEDYDEPAPVTQRDLKRIYIGG